MSQSCLALGAIFVVVLFWQLLIVVEGGHSHGNNPEVSRSCLRAFEGELIYAVGDSLTSGFTLINSEPLVVEDHPYTHAVKSAFRHSTVYNFGEEGTDSAEVKEHLMELLPEELNCTDPVPSVFILLSGSNDLLRAENENHRDHTLKNILAMHRSVKAFAKLHHRVIDTIAVSIPRIKRLTPKEEEYRRFVNHALKEYSDGSANCSKVRASRGSHSNSGTGDTESCCCTLFLDVDSSSQDYLGEDGIHFTKSGYQAFGVQVVDTLCKLV